MHYSKINLDKLIIYDIETLSTCFIMNCMDYKTKTKKSFVLFNDDAYNGQATKMYYFLRRVIKQGYSFVGFNNLAFDAQVIDYFYNWCTDPNDPLHVNDNTTIIDVLYTKAQELINTQNGQERYDNLVQENSLFAPQIDVYKQKHYDRMQRRTSLKWIQFSIRFHNIEEMPINHDDNTITKTDIPNILEYCWNDVISTYEFFNLIKFETELRINLSNEYKRNLINASEPRLAREIFGTILAPQLGITYSELKKLRTVRKLIPLKDIIFPYVKFNTLQLKQVLEDIKKIVIDCNPHSTQTFKYDFNYNGLDVYLGLGGIHACVKPGVYAPTADEYCKDSDAKSFYPNLSIQNNLRPAHLGDAFETVYSSIYEQRKNIPKSDPRNYVFKIILNSTYGLSSEINSYFYDKQFTYGITINGQLSLLMLCEALYLSVPGVKILQKNTDGISYIYNKKYQPIVEKIWKWWEATTKIELEHADYSKMIIQDVNNYIAIDLKGKLKKKGMFETANMDYHKNPSNLIIPKAVEQYFINGTPVEETVRNCEDIFDFCAGVKRKSNFKLNLYKTLNSQVTVDDEDPKQYVLNHGWIEYEGGSWIKSEWIKDQKPYDRMAVPLDIAFKSVCYEQRYTHGLIEIIEPQQKVTRFVVTTANNKQGGLLVKDFDDGRKVSALANTLVQPLNKITDTNAQNYDIDYNFYIRKAKDIVESISPRVTQTTLF